MLPHLEHHGCACLASLLMRCQSLPYTFLRSALHTEQWLPALVSAEQVRQRRRATVTRTHPPLGRVVSPLPCQGAGWLVVPNGPRAVAP